VGWVNSFLGVHVAFISSREKKGKKESFYKQKRYEERETDFFLSEIVITMIFAVLLLLDLVISIESVVFCFVFSGCAHY